METHAEMSLNFWWITKAPMSFENGKYLYFLNMEKEFIKRRVFHKMSKNPRPNGIQI